MVNALIESYQLKKVRMKHAKLSLPLAAAKIGISPLMLRMWEDGSCLPTWEQLRVIARVYRISVTQFYMPKPKGFWKRITDAVLTER